MGTLLVVSHTHQRHHTAQHHAQSKCQRRYHQRGSHTFEIELPAVGLKKSLIEFHKEILPKIERCAAFAQCGECLKQFRHFPVHLSR